MPKIITDETERLNFLPKLFGGLFNTIRGENLVYSLFTQMCPTQYGGGFWDFIEADNGAQYMAWQTPDRLKISWDGNGFEGEMSADATGIAVTILALSYLERDTSLLFDVACEHPEAQAILGLID